MSGGTPPAKTNQTRVYAGGPRRKTNRNLRKERTCGSLRSGRADNRQSYCDRKLDEARRLDFSKSIRLYSQTTKSLDEFWEIVEYIKEHISPDVTFEYYDTICRQVANRMPNLRKFAASHDLIFFVSGKKSSNGKMLFEECKKVNPNSHLIDSADEIDDSLLPGVNSIGVCGATSTPKWLMEEISEAIKAQIKRQ